MGGDNRVKMVHRNLLLPLLSNPLDHAGELDNSRSLVNPKENYGHTGGNWNGHIELQMVLLRRNRKGRNDVMTARSNVQN